MRLLTIHTCPLWQEANGTRTVGLYVRPIHPPVVGWCNAALIELHGHSRWFLLPRDA